MSTQKRIPYAQWKAMHPEKYGGRGGYTQGRGVYTQGRGKYTIKKLVQLMKAK